MENNNTLPFLDVLVEKTDLSFKTSSYQKEQYIDLGMNFNSSIPEKYKFNLINCLIDRAFKINSTVTGFFQKIEKLKQYFYRNDFPVNLINKTIERKLYKLKYENNNNISVEKKKLYINLPYLNKLSNKSINNDIQKLINRFYPHINLNIIFQNNFSIASFFPFKDRIPTSMISNLVYKYSCAQCPATYYGETSRHLHTRIAEHRGLSSRTGIPITNPSHSNIRNHAMEKSHEINSDNFSILFKSTNKGVDVKIAESLYILKDKPTLNTIDSLNLIII